MSGLKQPIRALHASAHADKRSFARLASSMLNRKPNELAACAITLIALLWAAYGCAARITSGSIGGAQSLMGVTLGWGAQNGPLPHAADPGVDGFSGQRAYDQVVKQVSFGPRPPGSEAIRRLQEYILAQLQSFGCKTDVDDFHASTPKGTIAMKNIVAKIPGVSQNIILLGTHYDTKLLPNFVGANDAGSSTGVMLEIARVLCKKPLPATVWIAFFDGEEAFNPDWRDPDNTYGSREMAAKLSISGELPHVKAMVLADMVGIANLHIKREENSTRWLVDILWNNAAKLGYGTVFVNEYAATEDDHLSFLHRNVPSADIIDLETPQAENTWHTTADVISIVHPRPLQIVGDVILSSLSDISRHIH